VLQVRLTAPHVLRCGIHYTQVAIADVQLQRLYSLQLLLLPDIHGTTTGLWCFGVVACVLDCAPCKHISYTVLTVIYASVCHILHTYRTVKVRGEEIQTPNKPDTAAGTRDAMAKVCVHACMRVLLVRYCSIE
jgi:hypothetical protein